jgi:hypothetical protein
MGNLKEIPFTEVFERVQQQMRDTATGSDVEARYKGYVNDIYLRDLPSRYKFNFCKTSSTVTINASYSTSTASVGVSSKVVTGTGTVWTSAMTGRKIYFTADSNNIYTFTYTGATSAAITPAYQGASAVTTGGYTIIDYDYSVGSTFVDGEHTSIYYWTNSSKQYLKRADEEWWKSHQSIVPGTVDRYRFFEEDSAGNEVFYITPPSDTSRILQVEHEKRLSSMTEYVGNAAVALGSSAVTGSSTLFTANVAVGDYFRIDSKGSKANSKWYKITAVTSNTVLAITPTWQEASVTTAEAFTISKLPDIPYHIQDALIWGSCMLSAQDQGDNVGVRTYMQLYLDRIGLNIRRNERKNLNKRMKPDTRLLRK